MGNFVIELHGFQPRTITTHNQLNILETNVLAVCIKMLCLYILYALSCEGASSGPCFPYANETCGAYAK